MKIKWTYIILFILIGFYLIWQYSGGPERYEKNKGVLRKYNINSPEVNSSQDIFNPQNNIDQNKENLPQNFNWPIETNQENA